MPNAIYNYVYYEPLAVGGPVTRQNRNPVTSPSYAPVPGITVPPTNDLAPGSTFTPDLPPASYTHSGDTYSFGFMNVSGCAGTGETSTDYGHLPGSASFPPLIVGNQVINILVVYIRTGGGGVGPPPIPSIYLDAFDETTGAFLDNFFVTGIAPNNLLTPNVNIYGSLARETHAETVAASANPLPTTGVAPSAAIFDKWVKLEGPPLNPVIAGHSPNLVVNGSTGSDITTFAFYKEPVSAYITGGYESSDIILFSPFSVPAPGTPAPIGIPIVGGDTTVLPGVNYGFAAIVRNDSEFDVSTNVTFWLIPEGLATLGVMLGPPQAALVPAGGFTVVYSSMPFINAGGADHHTCAAVSLNTPDTPCSFNPTSSADAVNIPSPVEYPSGIPLSHSCSAWRNTDSIFVFPEGPWHIILGLGEFHPPIGDPPIRIQIQAQHVAANFMQNDKVLEVIRANRAVYGKTPAYLIPALRKMLPSVNLKHEVTLVSKGKIEAHNEGNGHLLNFEHKKETTFKVSGKVPANAKSGDIYLVKVTAHYPKTERTPAKVVEFLEALVVKNK